MNITDHHHPDPRIEDVRMFRLDGRMVGYHWTYQGELQIAMIVRASEVEQAAVRDALGRITGETVGNLSQPPERAQEVTEHEPSCIITSLDQWE